jgi:hypothetical protein
MLRNERAKVMCVRRGVSVLLVVLIASVLARPARAQLIEGLDSYTDAIVGLSTTKWTGPRVYPPVPAPRPRLPQHLASQWWPLRVHAPGHVAPRTMQRVLHDAERTFEALHAADLLTSFGDAGQGGSGARDLYLVDTEQARAEPDASGNFSALDGTRAFSIIDARTPAARSLACVAQALVEAQLLELDPAENVKLRRGLAAYYASLISGETCEDERAAPEQTPFQTSASAAAWFERLSARQDRNRGVFLFEMWQFARQRTWEGRDLRASPDLLEAIAKALSLGKEDFDLVAAELAEGVARKLGSPVLRASWDSLPEFPSRSAPALEVLGSVHLRIELGEPRPANRLRAWSRGDAGGRYTLSATRLDEDGRPLSRLELAPRRDPNGQLSIELDAHTYAVSITLTRVADQGVPDPDTLWDAEPRHAGLIVDVAP